MRLSAPITARTAPETSHSAIRKPAVTQNACCSVERLARSCRRRTRTPTATRPPSGRGARSSLQTPSRCRNPSSANAEQQERHDRGEDLERDRARVGQQVVLDEGVDVAAQLGARPAAPWRSWRATRQGYPVAARLGSAVVPARSPTSAGPCAWSASRPRCCCSTWRRRRSRSRRSPSRWAPASPTCSGCSAATRWRWPSSCSRPAASPTASAAGGCS